MASVTTPALRVTSADSPLEPTTIERRDLGTDDVLIDVAWAGICHSDLHQVRGEWNNSVYPMVPGHEIAGTVSAVGSGVTLHKVGDRVGVGCMVDSCGVCEACKDGEEQFCEKGFVGTYNASDYDGDPTYGGYSQHVVVRESFVVRIPDSIELDVAAPLLCAGVTTYSPLHHWKVGPGSKVAVVGLGGLGHMGVQFAHALGAEVTVLSQSLSKQADGEKLGADHYYATSDKQTFKDLRGSFDLILNTVSANLPLDRFLSLLRRDGVMVNVGAPSDPDSFNIFSLIGGRKSLAGSNIGGIAETQQMLDFCGEKGIAAVVERISAADVNDAYERMSNSDVRYRFVIDTSTISAS